MSDTPPHDDVRSQLAAAVEQRGLALLDGWLGPVGVKQEILAVLYAGRSLLLEGPVGSGKTLLAGLVAAALPPIRLAGCDFNCLPEEQGCHQCRAGLVTGEEHEVTGADRFVRIQGSPDLLPEDLVGDIDPAAALQYGALDPRALRPGRLLRAHRQLCFVDEINRLSERLQNLLLEVLEERAMTVGGYDVRFPVDTVVVATMNPEEYVGVERLSEALRDRFERVRLDYPSPDDERRILLDRSTLRATSGMPREAVAGAIVGLAHELRQAPEVQISPSVRATLASYELALAHQRLTGCDWRDAVRRGLRLGLRGRVSLAATHALAADPQGFVDSAVARVAL